jgi:Tol biopolymer transport system component
MQRPSRSVTCLAAVSSIAALALATVPAIGPASAAADNGLTLVSHTPAGAPGDTDSTAAAVSDGGRFVCFTSTASDIVTPDGEATSDVFRYDSTTDTSMVVSRRAGGAPAGRSYGCRISRSGQFMVYESFSPAVASGLPGGDNRLVLFDAVSQSATIVSRTPDGTPTPLLLSWGFDISADGRYVVYVNRSLSVGGGLHDYDVFRYDRVSGTTTSLVHTGPTPRTTLRAPSVSADGRYVTYFKTPPKGQQAIGPPSLYLLDTVTSTTTLVSGTPAGTINGMSADLSANGGWIAFSTIFSGLASDANGEEDVFLYNATTGRTRLVSRTAAGAEGNDRSTAPSISANGRFVAFSSNATDLVSEADANGGPDVYRYDRQTATTVLVSRSLDGDRAAAEPSFLPSQGGDGKVAFRSASTDLVAGDESFHADVYLWTP